MAAYYNEIEPYAAQWLRNLISAGHIAPGDVDERSIEDVRPDDLRGYTQCHFFAGIGVWSSALRRAGWPDDRPVWTGSCPCQPFSAAGKGLGFADERHLWPAWHHLISECLPPVVFGEQVASKDVDPWIDLVFDDLEAMEYACAANPFPSAGIGAPHIRDRTFFVAYAPQRGRREKRSNSGGLIARDRAQGFTTGSLDGCVSRFMADAERGPAERQRLDVGSAASGVRSSSREQRVRDDARHGGDAGRLADSDSGQCDGLAVVRGAERDGANTGRPQGGSELESRGDVRGLADADEDGRAPQAGRALHHEEHHPESRCRAAEGQPASGPTNGFWRAADWLLCRDGKWRPVEPGTFPLAHGAPARVGRLRAYGNAINREAAAAFIAAADEAMTDCST
ncbi:DNA cytosine methyltransferase [Paraburkholderia tropica]|nr:DNA cytosine methyltransferase [Paraburkholderia tropica]